VLTEWQGLGYYSRARALQAGARAVVERHGGTIPDRLADLARLPGVGRYTAGAIASIAFGRRTPVVDGTVRRVLCRLFALRGDPRRPPLEPLLWTLAGALLPPGRARHMNQALMELGATVCVPRKPRCGECPLARECAARREGLAGSLPERRRRPGATPLRMVAAIVVRDGRVLVVERSDGARGPHGGARNWWTGLWTFPSVEVERRETPERAVRRALLEAAGIVASPKGLAHVATFSVTRFKVTLDAYRCTPGTGTARAPRGARVAWRRPEDLAGFAMPAPHRRIASALFGGAPALVPP
jgi:A/G-specific adenine glycosylase